jgi:hypothetical protein
VREVLGMRRACRRERRYACRKSADCGQELCRRRMIGRK